MKKIFLVIVMAVLSIVIVSCGPRYDAVININDFDKSWTFDASVETTVSFAHTMEKTTDVNKGQQALLDKHIKEFTAEMKEKYGWNITVKHEQYGGYPDVLSKVGNQLAQGKEPSMAYAYPDHVASYIASDKVLPLDNLINNNDSRVALTKDEQKDYVDAFMQEGREYDHNNTTLSVPFSKSTEVMFYNKTFFEKNGLEVPKTWAQLEEVAKKIKAIKSDITPFGYDSDDNLFITRTAQLGTPYTTLDDALNGQAVFNTPENQAMVQSLVDLHKAGLLTTKGILGGYTSDQFKVQKLMMAVGSTGGTNHNVPSKGEFEVGVAPLPQETEKESKQILQGPSIVLFRKGIRPTQTDKNGKTVWAQPQPTQAEINEMVGAWMFYKFITRPDKTIEQATGTGYLPVRKSSYDTEIYKSYITSATSGAEKAKADVLKLAKELIDKNAFFTSPAYATSSKARAAVGVLVTDALAGKAALDTLFKRAVAQAS